MQHFTTSISERDDRDNPYSYAVRVFAEGRKQIGRIDVELYNTVVAKKWVTIWEVTQSGIDAPYRNQGLGIVLYSTAIDHGLSKGYTVTSGTMTSGEAHRLWLSSNLNRMYDISRDHKRYWVKGRK